MEIESDIIANAARKIVLAKVSELYDYEVDELTATEPSLWVYHPLLVGFSEPDEK